LIAADSGGGPLALPHINAAAHLALLQCERGELDTAETTALETTAAAAAAGWANTAQGVCAYLALARVGFDRGELAEADGWLERIAGVVAVAPQPHVQLAAALVLAARREAAGNPERALAGLHETAEQLRPWTPPRALAERWLLTEAVLLGKSGDAAQARGMLDQLSRPQTPPGCRRGRPVAPVARRRGGRRGRAPE
jgi:LuxR family transcriptional regulator, maltose regulon positive regulatory protein